MLVVLIPDANPGSPLKVCPEWKAQQKILWAEVQKESGRRKSRCKVRDLLADGRCSQAVLHMYVNFLSAGYGCGKAGPG